MRLKNLLKRKKQEQRESLSWNNLSEFQRQLISNGQVIQQYNTREISGHSVVMGCVNLLSEAAASLPLCVYKGKDKIDDHSLLQVLSESASENLSAGTFWEWASRSLLLHGQFHALIKRKDGDVIELRPYYPNTCYAYPKNYDYTIYQSDFFYRTTNSQNFLAHEIFRIREPWGDFYNGISRLTHASLTCRKTLAVERNITEFASQGTRPAAILTGVPGVNPTELANTRKAIEQYQSQASTSGKLLTLPAGYDIKSWRISPKDSEFIESEKISYSDLARLFNIPGAAVGLMESGLAYASIRELYSALVRLGIRPHLRKIEQSINSLLLTEQERNDGIYVQFDLSSLLMSDASERTDYYNKGVSDGWLTIDEIREREGLPEMPEQEQEQDEPAFDLDAASDFDDAETEERSEIVPIDADDNEPDEKARDSFVNRAIKKFNDYLNSDHAKSMKEMGFDWSKILLASTVPLFLEQGLRGVMAKESKTDLQDDASEFALGVTNRLAKKYDKMLDDEPEKAVIEIVAEMRPALEYKIAEKSNKRRRLYAKHKGRKAHKTSVVLGNREPLKSGLKNAPDGYGYVLTDDS